jgi:hypothetical protein
LESGKVSGNKNENGLAVQTQELSPATETGYFATGYANNKYYAGEIFLYNGSLSSVVCLLDFLKYNLTYAEALLQAEQ